MVLCVLVIVEDVHYLIMLRIVMPIVEVVLKFVDFLLVLMEKKDFTLATKDNNLARYIGSLIDIGVTSLKVEGRMRSLYYLATVIGTYREIIDRYYDGSLTEDILETLEERLSRVANRAVSTHYFIKGSR